MDQAVYRAFTEELIKLCASVEELRSAYRRLNPLKLKTKFLGEKVVGKDVANQLSPKLIAAMTGASTVPTRRQAGPILRGRARAAEVESQAGRPCMWAEAAGMWARIWSKRRPRVSSSLR